MCVGGDELAGISLQLCCAGDFFWEEGFLGAAFGGGAALFAAMSHSRGLSFLHRQKKKLIMRANCEKKKKKETGREWGGEKRKKTKTPDEHLI